MIRYNPRGLSPNEVAESRRQHGDNVITPPKDDSVWKLLADKFRDPIIRILLLAAVFIAVMLRMNRHLARAKRAAEESNRMKGIFIRNITHEINTPLNSIVGFAELAAASDDADAASCRLATRAAAGSPGDRKSVV